MNPASTDVIVIGGGVIGLNIAYSLSKEGLKVCLVEKRHLGSGASGSSAAMLETQIDAHRGEPFFSLALRSQNLYPSLYEEIKSETGIDFQYDNCGILQLAYSVEEVRQLKNEVARQKSLGLRLNWKSAEELQTLLPFINPEYLGGAFFEEDGQINGELFVSGLVKILQKGGVRILTDTGPLSWETTASRLLAIKLKNETLSANTFIVAAGAWTDDVLKPLHVQTGIRPIRGQLLVFDTPQLALPYPIYTLNQGYITPKKEGYTFVGSTLEDVGFDEEPTEQAKTTLLEKAKFMFPGILRKNLRGMSAGLRPCPPDNLPLIGPLPQFDNLLLASGHHRNGILLAPVTSEMITCCVCNQKFKVDPAPFAPGRNGRRAE